MTSRALAPTLRLGACLGVLLAGAVSVAGAQQRRTCDIELVNDPSGNSRVTAYTLPSGDRNTFVGGGVRALCRRDAHQARPEPDAGQGTGQQLGQQGPVD